MKLLILSRYSRLGASSRVRLYQFIPRFEAAGISCTVMPLLNDQYLQEFYAGKTISKFNLLKGYFFAFQSLKRAGRFDLVLIEKEIFPFVPAVAEWWLNRRRVPYIVDYDDAIFHNYDLSEHPVVRALFRRKIASVMRRAVTVVCGNKYLADYARRACARHVLEIPTVIDTDRYQPRAPGHDEERFSQKETPGGLISSLVIGWVGSPPSLKYLKALRPVLAELASRYDISLHIVGGGGGIGLENIEQVFEWSEEEEADLISSFDIGIMPLEDSPWERGKCGYKLIQYMGCGIPVVGSPIGVNVDIIREDVNGYLASSQEQWKFALERLLGDEHLRRSMGGNGREFVIDRYSLDVAAKCWIAELKQHYVRDLRDNPL